MFHYNDIQFFYFCVECVGNASQTEKNLWDKRVNAICAGNKKSTMMNGHFYQQYSKSLCLGDDDSVSKLYYSDNYGTHDNDEAL